MKNRLVISFCVHLLLGILFVFPIYSAEDFEFSGNSLENIGYFGKESGNDLNTVFYKNTSSSYRIKCLPAIKELGSVSFLPIKVCETDSCSDFLLRYSHQIVDISLLKCIRSVVMLC